jgi:hypothetical protein
MGVTELVMRRAALLEITLLILCSAFILSLSLYVPGVSNMVEAILPQFSHHYWSMSFI